MLKIGKSLIVAFLIALCFTGCQSAKPEETVAEEEYIESPKIIQGYEREIVALSDLSELRIEKYRVRGEGPDGAYFDWQEVKSPKFALADLRRGWWRIYAEGINEYGEVVIKGTLDTFLSEDTPVENLVFDEGVRGYGSVKCAISWNKAQTKRPKIDIYIKKLGENWNLRPNGEIQMGDGVALWQVDDMPNGSYQVKFILTDSGNEIGGTAAALVVLTDKESIGAVELIAGDLSHAYGIELQEIFTPLDEHDIEIVSPYAFYSGEGDPIWYLNGEEIGTGDTVLINAERGYHRLNAIRSEDRAMSESSVYIYSDGENIRLADKDEIIPSAEGENR